MRAFYTRRGKILSSSLPLFLGKEGVTRRGRVPAAKMAKARDLCSFSKNPARGGSQRSRSCVRGIPGAGQAPRLRKSGEVQHNKERNQIRRDEHEGQLRHRARGDIPRESGD